jgi:hypothetical protein
MRKLVRFTILKTDQNVVVLCNAFDSTPKFKFINILIRSQYFNVSHFESDSTILNILLLIDIQSVADTLEHLQLLIDVRNVHY